MSTKRETLPAYYRPAERPLQSLTNEELQAVLEVRMSKVKLDPDGFWEDERIVYWVTMMHPLMELYEAMLEVQSRYPKSEVHDWYADKLLPLVRQYGLKELKKDRLRLSTDEDTA